MIESNNTKNEKEILDHLASSAVPTKPYIDPFWYSIYNMTAKGIDKGLLNQMDESIIEWEKELYDDFGLHPWQKLINKIDNLPLSNRCMKLIKEQSCMVLKATIKLAHTPNEYQYAYIFNSKWSPRRKKIIKRHLLKLEPDVREMCVFMDTYALGDIGKPPFTSSSFYVLDAVVKKWPNVLNSRS